MLHCKFSGDYNGERIFKIGHYLTKLCVEHLGFTFFGQPCALSVMYSLGWSYGVIVNVKLTCLACTYVTPALLCVCWLLDLMCVLYCCECILKCPWLHDRVHVLSFWGICWSEQSGPRKSLLLCSDWWRSIAFDTADYKVALNVLQYSVGIITTIIFGYWICCLQTVKPYQYKLNNGFE